MRKKIISAVMAGVVLVVSGCGAIDENKIAKNNTEVAATTNKNIETTTIKETTTPEQTTEDTTKVIESVDDFNINAARVNLPEDRLLQGYDFSDAVFIGDSRTEGLTVYNVLTTSTVLATRGLMASSALTDKFVDLGNGKGTVVDYLKLHKFKKVYIMLGLNELGCLLSTYTDSYKELIDEVRQAEPDSEIYIMPVIPMVEERTDEVYNNEIIAKFNEALRGICTEKNVPLINVSAALVNEKGTLPSELSTDGIHLNAKGLRRLVNYLILATAN